jgi:hypothetical protein
MLARIIAGDKGQERIQWHLNGDGTYDPSACIGGSTSCSRVRDSFLPTAYPRLSSIILRQVLRAKHRSTINYLA